MDFALVRAIENRVFHVSVPSIFVASCEYFPIPRPKFLKGVLHINFGVLLWSKLDEARKTQNETNRNKLNKRLQFTWGQQVLTNNQSPRNRGTLIVGCVRVVGRSGKQWYAASNSSSGDLVNPKLPSSITAKSR